MNCILTIILGGSFMNEVRNPKYIKKEYPAFIDDDDAIKYYEKKFQRMKDRNTPISFNLWGLLFGEFWFIYRKMLLWGFSILLLHIGVISLSFYFDFTTLAAIASVAISILCGFFGNYLYMNYADNCIIKASVMTYEERQAYYKDNGGASFRILFGAIASILVILFALAVSIAG